VESEEGEAEGEVEGEGEVKGEGEVEGEGEAKGETEGKAADGEANRELILEDDATGEVITGKFKSLCFDVGGVLFKLRFGGGGGGGGTLLEVLALEHTKCKILFPLFSLFFPSYFVR